jgi:integrase/recombinase XerD
MTNITRFLNGLKNEHTKVAYENDLKQFFDFTGKDETEITYADIYDYKVSMSEYSSATTARKLTAIKSYFNFLSDMEFISTNPSAKIKIPKVKNHEKEYIPMDEAKKLLDVAKSPRDKAIIALYLSTGMRVNELVNLTVEQYEKDEIVFVAKGDKERKVYLNDKCRGYIDEYLKVRKDSGIDNLFVSNYGTPMRHDLIAKMLKKNAKKAGLSEDITNHSLRHSFISAVALENGVAVAREVVCHANLSTTQRYVHNTEETIRKAMVSVF